MKRTLLLAALGLSYGCSSNDTESGAPGVEATRSSSAHSGRSASPSNSTPPAKPSSAASASSVAATSSAPAPAVSTAAASHSTASSDPNPPAVGDGPQIGGCPLFPADNPWNQDISKLALHPKSEAWVKSVGLDALMHPDFGTEWEGAPIGIPVVVVAGDQSRVPVEFEYADESDPGPYPIPADVPIEGGPDSDGDRHVLVVDSSTCTLYELYAAYPVDDGASWTAGSGAIFDLTSNDLRPDGWTSADAAGLPILPGLVRYEEVTEGEIRHALRFTIKESQRAYIKPGTHGASSETDPNLPPMGARFRMKSDYDCSGYSRETQVICTALKRFGMLVADNGSNWYLSGAPDARWDDDALGDIKVIPGSAFEVVDTGPTITY